MYAPTGALGVLQQRPLPKRSARASGRVDSVPSAGKRRVRGLQLQHTPIGALNQLENRNA